MDDWLNLDRPAVSPQAGIDKANEVARLYHDTFVANGAGAQLLKMWTERDFHSIVPVNSSINVYAAAEARRDFIRGIHIQIELARRGVDAETSA
jgi:hypothetical protein